MNWSACDEDKSSWQDSRGLGVAGTIREVGDGEKGVLVKDLAVQEPLKEVPRHWCFEAPGKQDGVRGGFWVWNGGGPDAQSHGFLDGVL